MNKTWIIIQREFINRVSKVVYPAYHIDAVHFCGTYFCPVVVIHGQAETETGSHY